MEIYTLKVTVPAFLFIITYREGYNFDKRK